MADADEREEGRLPRPVRSYALRKGRLTKGQKRALAEILPRYELPPLPKVVDWRQAFGRTAPVAVEIGFGGGDALFEMARRHPNWNWMGLDVYPPGAGKLMLALEKTPLPNVRVALTDAVPFLMDRVPFGSLEAVYVFFPDPWPKARHHKRRLIQRPFLDLLAERMATGADLYLATDWGDYAEWMVEALEIHPCFANAQGSRSYAPRCPDRPPTAFERRGANQGHEVYDLHYWCL